MPFLFDNLQMCENSQRSLNVRLHSLLSGFDNIGEKYGLSVFNALCIGFGSAASGFVHIGEVIDLSYSGFNTAAVILFTDTGTSVHDNRETIGQLTDPAHNIQIQLRLRQVDPMRGTKRTGKRINA